MVYNESLMRSSSSLFRVVPPLLLLLLVALPFFGWVSADQVDGGVEGSWVVEAEIERDVDEPVDDDPRIDAAETFFPLVTLLAAVECPEHYDAFALSLPSVRAPPTPPRV